VVVLSHSRKSSVIIYDINAIYVQYTLVPSILSLSLSLSLSL